jgi:AcrR family transcriptional regulator
MPTPEMPATAADTAVRRGLQRRREAATAEVSRLIEAGREILGSGSSLRVADIVKAAGSSNEAFYRYFGSKDGFVSAVVQDGAERVADLIRRRLPAEASGEAGVRVVVETAMSQLTNPQVAAASRNILAHAHEPGDVSFAETLADLLRDSLESAGSPDAGRDAALAGGAILARLQGFVASRQTPSDRDVEHLIEFILGAARRA